MKRDRKNRSIRIFSCIMAFVVFAATLTMPVSAAPSVASQLANPNVYFKQTGKYCTLDSLAMVFRRKAIIDGNNNWNVITEKTMANYSNNWQPGLAGAAKYKNAKYGLDMTSSSDSLYSMKKNNYKKNSSPQKIKAELKKQLDKHPEGIVLYIYESQKSGKAKWEHAVVLTGYSGDTFYCVDPANGAPKGIIKLQNSVLTDHKHANTKSIDKLFSYAVKIWYVQKSNNSVAKASGTKNTTTAKTTVTTPTINVTQYPSSITQGSAFGLRGTITSKNKITSLKGSITNSSGKTVQSTSEAPNSKSVNIRNMKVNNKLLFGKLSPGQYTLKIVAKDSTGGSKTWSKKITVKASTKLNINFTQYPKSITKGKSFSLRGTFSSNYAIKSINGYIINSKGTVVQSTTDKFNQKTVNIRATNLNQKLRFGKLAKGKYTLKVVIKTSSGTTKTWSKTFTVK